MSLEEGVIYKRDVVVAEIERDQFQNQIIIVLDVRAMVLPRVKEPRHVLEQVVHDLYRYRVDDGRDDRSVARRHGRRRRLVEGSREYDSHVDDTDIDPHQHYYECRDHEERDAGMSSTSSSRIEGFRSPVDE